MKNIDSLRVAKLALLEIRLLIKQKRFEQISDIAEVGSVIPIDESNTTLEELTLEKLGFYIDKYPERKSLTHFDRTLNSIQRTPWEAKL